MVLGHDRACAVLSLYGDDLGIHDQVAPCPGLEHGLPQLRSCQKRSPGESTRTLPLSSSDPMALSASVVELGGSMQAGMGGHTNELVDDEDRKRPCRRAFRKVFQS